MAAERDDEMFDDLGKFTAREPDNYAEAFRQREILRTSSEVNELFSEARQAFERDEIDKNAERSIVRSAVSRLIMDVEHIIKSTGGNDLLNKKQIYEVELSPPEELYQIIQSNDVRILGNPDLSDKVAENGGVIRGLWGYLEAPEYFTAQWTVHTDIRHRSQKSVSRAAISKMPVEASRETFREIRAFLSSVDLDLGPNLPDYMGEGGPGL